MSFLISNCLQGLLRQRGSDRWRIKCVFTLHVAVEMLLVTLFHTHIRPDSVAEPGCPAQLQHPHRLRDPVHQSSTPLPIKGDVGEQDQKSMFWFSRRPAACNI